MKVISIGLMKLTDTVGQHLGGAWAKGAFRRITIKQLMTHTAGLAETLAAVQNVTPMDLVVLYPPNITLKEAAMNLANFTLDYKPWTEFQYTESGFQVLGAVIEKEDGS